MTPSSELTLIYEPLKEIIIAEEGKTINLDCKLSNYNLTGKWYKDGTLIMSCDKTKISKKGLWQFLQIESVDKDDEGLYCFAVQTITCIYTKCVLFVKPHAYDNVTHNFSEDMKHGVGVYLNLRNVYIDEKEKVKLHAEFSTSIHKCTWFKNNRVVPPRYPKHLMDEEEHTVSKLYFNSTKKTDSGLYYVVAETYDNKYLCSYANILIDKNCTKGLYNNDAIPNISQGPGDYIDVFDQDNVRLMFKVSYDIYTIIEWTKDGTEVKFSDRVKCETYFNKYIALKIRCVTDADSGKYYLVLRDKVSSITVISSTHLNVKRHSSRPAQCTVTERLLPAMASVGNGVTFQASFHIPEPKLNYVVWNVGHYDIEKSNTKFKVLCNGSEFVLHIPVVTPDMNGEICCQLRQHLPPQHSILLCATTSYLTVVPPRIMEDVSKLNITVQQKNIYSESSLSLVVPGTIPNSQSETSASCSDIIMHFQFCRMSGGNLFFKVMNEEECSEETLVNVEKKDSDPNALFPTLGDWTISWVRPNENDWYAFDIYEGNGEYSEIGITDLSRLDIKEPPEDKLFKFRIRRIRPKRKQTNIKFCYAPTDLKASQSKKFLPNREYKKTYSNGIRIGLGSYGFVNIVYSRDGKVLTAKTSRSSKKIKKLCRLNKPIREFEIMKALSHPNTINIVNGFFKSSCNGYIITMEYLWGGELIEDIIERESLTEVDAIVYVRQILLALEYIHSKNIVHLDIKPGNVMCIHRNSRTIKIIDFGLARTLERTVIVPTTYGSKDFMPPEIINGQPIGTQCDMWNLGVLTYWLLTGRMPFEGSNWRLKSNFICQALYCYDDTDYWGISDRAKEFISFLLRIYPDERMTAVMALNNRWITHGPSEGKPKKVPIPARGGTMLVPASTHAEQQWKTLIFLVLAVLRFRGKRQSNPHHGRRRVSARLLARRKNKKHQKQM